jgi:hypothetical protein
VYIQAECSRTTDPQHLKELLSTLLNPQKPIEELETVDWIKWLIAGGKTPVEFASIGKYILMLLIYRSKLRYVHVFFMS